MSNVQPDFEEYAKLDIEFDLSTFRASNGSEYYFCPITDKAASAYRAGKDELKPSLDRAETLLKVVHEFIEKQKNSRCDEYSRIFVIYDEAECDGNCLLDDITTLLEEIEYNNIGK